MAVRNSVLLLVFSIVCLLHVKANRAGGPRLKFCDYILQIGVQNNHCPPSGMGRAVKMHNPEEIPAQDNDETEGSSKGLEGSKSSATPVGYKSCFLKFNPNNCLRSKYCASNLLCVDVVGNPCCVTQGECPTKQQLDVKCVRVKPTNWCNSDYDCGRGSLCCDTGCGYNICVA